MHKLTRLVISWCVAGGSLFFPAFSQADIKIGFVDPVALIQNAPQSQAALNQLELEFRPRNDEILELQRDRSPAPSLLTLPRYRQRVF